MGARGHRPDAARLGAYLAGDLSVAKRREVELHLAGCEPCGKALRRMRQAHRLLVEEFPEDAPGAVAARRAAEAERSSPDWEMDARLRREIDRLSREGDAAGDDARRPWLWWLAPAALAAAAAAVLAAAWSGGWLRLGPEGAAPEVTLSAAPAERPAGLPAPAPGTKLAALVTLRAGPDAHVALGPDRDAAWRVLKLDETIPEGARVRTVRDARLGLQAGAAALVLDGDSEAELRVLETTRTELFLARGMVVLRGAGVRVSTLDHDVVSLPAPGGKGASFAVTRGAETTLVDVFDGAVAVAAAAHPAVFVTLTAPVHAVLVHNPDLARTATEPLDAAEVAALTELGSMPIFAIGAGGATLSGSAAAAEVLAASGLVLASAGEPGAEVRADGVAYGDADLVIRLSLGAHRVAFFRGGIETHAEVVDVVPGPVPQKVDEKPADPRAAIRRAVMETVRGYLPRVRGCYERVLKHDPETTGKVVARFVVRADGTVDTAEVTADTLPYPAVAGCVLGELKTWKFPAPADGKAITVHYPFVFTSAETTDDP
ncbi:MAG TPA: AgmX/PglI C-terminal domain-containing protein [Myxococcota bacterium]|jgi:hypothetical protein|nr:AgmX/PglI C-terminal domain-containing protein [Myxococcota bacterium]